MKQILIALLLAFTTCTMVDAKNQTTAGRHADADNTEITVTGEDMEKEDREEAEKEDAVAEDATGAITQKAGVINIDDEDFKFLGRHSGNSVIGEEYLVAIISVLAVFSLPVFILFVIFYFRYKNRQARYHLAEQALAAGQPLPEGFIRESKPKDYRSVGITNTFTGIGLFIFLWAITGSFGIGAIGLLVMFMGIGHWIIGNNQKKENRELMGGRKENIVRRQEPIVERREPVVGKEDLIVERLEPAPEKIDEVETTEKPAEKE